MSEERITTNLKSWCKQCQEATYSRPCPWCLPPILTCVICGTHPNCDHDLYGPLVYPIT